MARLNTRKDLLDFVIFDDDGAATVQTLKVSGSQICLTPDRALRGCVRISYGCDPQGPMGLIIDQYTYLPLISFDRMEVSR